jgi:hypothetical protein
MREVDKLLDKREAEKDKLATAALQAAEQKALQNKMTNLEQLLKKSEADRSSLASQFKELQRRRPNARAPVPVAVGENEQGPQPYRLDEARQFVDDLAGTASEKRVALCAEIERVSGEDVPPEHTTLIDLQFFLVSLCNA